MLLFATVREAAGVQLLSSADSSSDTPNVVSFAVRRRREGADDSLQISTLSFGFFHSLDSERIISIAALPPRIVSLCGRAPRTAAIRQFLFLSYFHQISQRRKRALHKTENGELGHCGRGRQKQKGKQTGHKKACRE